MFFWNRKRLEEDEAQLGIARMNWEGQNPDQLVVEAYNNAVTFAQNKVKFYFKEAERIRGCARGTRYAAIAFGVAGTIFPLLNATDTFRDADLASWGYVVVALALGMLTLDRFGGFSWRWTRDTVIWVSLRAELATFQHRWLKLVSSPSATHEQKLDEALTFRSSVDNIVARECQEWSEGVAEQGKQLLTELIRLQKIENAQQNAVGISETKPVPLAAQLPLRTPPGPPSRGPASGSPAAGT